MVLHSSIKKKKLYIIFLHIGRFMLETLVIKYSLTREKKNTVTHKFCMAQELSQVKTQDPGKNYFYEQSYRILIRAKKK